MKATGADAAGLEVGEHLPSDLTRAGVIHSNEKRPDRLSATAGLNDGATACILASEDLAAKVEGGERGGKSVKTIQGSADSLHRLRVGNHRVMYDLRRETLEKFCEDLSEFL